MICVIVGHCLIYWTDSNWFTASISEPFLPFKYVVTWLGSFHTYGFVLVSGYVFCFKKNEEKCYEKFLPFIWNKFKRLIVPYFFILIFWVIPFSLWFFPSDFQSVKVIMLDYVLGVAPKQLWFLTMLFFVFCIAWLFNKFLFKHTFISGLVFCVILYAFGNFIGNYIPNFFQIWAAFQYFPFFWIGYKIRQYGIKPIYRINVLFLIAINIGIYLLYILLPMDVPGYRIVHFLNGYLLNIAGSFTAFVFLQKISCLKKSEKTKITTFLQRRSMFIYLVHQQFVYLSIFLLNGLLHPILHSIINFVVCTSLAILMSLFFYRWKATRFLIGEKITFKKELKNESV